MNAVQLIRQASRIADEHEELAHALHEISRVRIMDTLSAIRMRSIANATLKRLKIGNDDGHEPVAGVLRHRTDACIGVLSGAAVEILK